MAYYFRVKKVVQFMNAKNSKYRNDMNFGIESGWGDKKTILKIWSGLSIHTLNRWLREMKENKKFRDAVINPSHKTLFVQIDRFEEFLRYKDKKKIKQ